MTDDELDRLIVMGHDTHSHKWMEVYPNGSVNEAEEADNNTSHYIKYPDKEVASIYEIHRECAEACNCDTCTMYRQLADYSKEEWVDRWGEDAWDYCNTYSLEYALLDDAREAGITGESVREQMVSAIEGIEYGYFNDEE